MVFGLEEELEMRSAGIQQTVDPSWAGIQSWEQRQRQRQRYDTYKSGADTFSYNDGAFYGNDGAQVNMLRVPAVLVRGASRR